MYVFWQLGNGQRLEEVGCRLRFGLDEFNVCDVRHCTKSSESKDITASLSVSTC